jgi:preprotein translocase subunit SecB
MLSFKNNIEKKIMLIEAPQLLFPYARSIVSNVTRDGGFMPLIIQPIDFELLYESRMKKEKH